MAELIMAIGLLLVAFELATIADKLGAILREMKGDEND